jgi:hypothetical protein
MLFSSSGVSGRELVSIPLEIFAEDDYRSVLPSDLLDLTNGTTPTTHALPSV